MIAEAHELGHPRPARHRAQPRLRPARVVPAGAGRRRPARPSASASSSATAAAPDGERAAQRLDQQLRRAGVDAGDRGRRPPGPVVPAPVRARAARPQLDQPRGARPSSSDTMRFWFDRGVDGFRIDVAHGLVKARGSARRRRRSAGRRRARIPSITRTGTATACTTSTAAGARSPMPTRTRACSWPRRGSHNAGRLAMYIRSR